MAFPSVVQASSILWAIDSARRSSPSNCPKASTGSSGNRYLRVQFVSGPGADALPGRRVSRVFFEKRRKVSESL